MKTLGPSYKLLPGIVTPPAPYLSHRYELHYAVAVHEESNRGETRWMSAEGDQDSTWDVTVQADGFDRSSADTQMP